MLTTILLMFPDTPGIMRRCDRPVPAWRRYFLPETTETTGLCTPQEAQAVSIDTSGGKCSR